MVKYGIWMRRTQLLGGNLYSLWDDIPPEAQAIIEAKTPAVSAQLKLCRYGRTVWIRKRPPRAERNRQLVRIYLDLVQAGVDRTCAVERAAAAVGLGWRMGYKILARRDLY